MKSTKKLIPAFFDLPKSITGSLPIGLVKTWVESDRTLESQEKILAPFKKQGTIVSSDSAGLSKLSASHSLIEVMKLINEPKEHIFRFGTSLGGKAVGIWAADNTQMFYTDDIEPIQVVNAMQAAQKEIKKGKVQVGIGIHHGSVYEIQGNIYGNEAEKVEYITEEFSRGGEILVSKTIFEQLENAVAIEEREGMYVLQDSPPIAPITPSKDPFYPAPFSKKFHTDIRNASISVNELAQTYIQTKTVLLARIFHEHQQNVLDHLTARVIGNEFFHSVMQQHELETIKTNGELAIYVCDNHLTAKTSAEELAKKAAEQNIDLNIGITSGEVLIFTLENDEKDIAGMPVNLASKFAEDTEERNVIFLEGTTFQKNDVNGYKQHQEEKSGIKLMSWKKMHQK